MAKHQDGYALLLVVFFMALLVIGTMSIGLRVATEGRRQKEEEMIWRGKQYTRGIKLYYRKLGRFPNSIDDLVKPKVGNIRFMRQAYTDPMNKDDGSWRLIYVGPGGQLIGSLKPQNTALPGQPGGQAGAPGSSSFGLGSSSSTGGFGAQGTTGTQGTGTAMQSTGAPGTGTGTGTGTDAQNIPSGDTPTIVGGNIIGVGSKINQPSIIVYDQATNYRLFEFIWNPAKDLGLPGAGGAPGGMPGQGTGAPGGSGAPGNPTPPQQPNPNPSPTPNPNPQQPQQ
jgi:hypothetical protein